MNRRTLLRSGATFVGTSLLAGCLGGNDIQDSDGDGVIDSEDYAPNDPEVQRKSDLQSGSGGGGGGSSSTTGSTGGGRKSATAGFSFISYPDGTFQADVRYSHNDAEKLVLSVAGEKVTNLPPNKSHLIYACGEDCMLPPLEFGTVSKVKAIYPDGSSEKIASKPAV